MKLAPWALLLTTAVASTVASNVAAEAPTPPPVVEEVEEVVEEVEDGWPANVPVMRWWEYAGGAALLGGSFAIRFTVDVAGEPTWTGGILLDEVIYDTSFVESPHLFRTWRSIGDIGYFASFAWSVVDPVIAGFSYDWGTAVQMTMMNLEAFSVFSMVLSFSQMLIQRERPATRECETPEKAAALGVSCGRGNQNVNRSFIGGHTGTAATAATLTCLHHAQLPLWGSRAADALPCVTATAMTALVFTSRTITGQHYFTDNLLGVGVGVMSGLVPWSLHYAFPLFQGLEEDAAELPLLPTGAIVAPNEGGATVQVTGILF
jgi:hypothetical protein